MNVESLCGMWPAAHASCVMPWARQNVQVLGNAKGVVAAIISVAIFRNPVSTLGAIGYSITVGGVVAYSQV